MAENNIASEIKNVKSRGAETIPPVDFLDDLVPVLVQLQPEPPINVWFNLQD